MHKENQQNHKGNQSAGIRFQSFLLHQNAQITESIHQEHKKARKETNSLLMSYKPLFYLLR